MFCQTRSSSEESPLLRVSPKVTPSGHAADFGTSPQRRESRHSGTAALGLGCAKRRRRQQHTQCSKLEAPAIKARSRRRSATAGLPLVLAQNLGHPRGVCSTCFFQRRYSIRLAMVVQTNATAMTGSKAMNRAPLANFFITDPPACRCPRN